MNVYQTIKYAASKGWNIHFDPNRKSVGITDKTGDRLDYSEYWQHEDGLVTPVTALIRLVDKIKRHGY